MVSVFDLSLHYRSEHGDLEESYRTMLGGLHVLSPTGDSVNFNMPKLSLSNHHPFL